MDTEQTRCAAAHDEAFNSVLEYVREHIIEKNEILQLFTLRLIYISELEQRGFPNPDYRNEKLIKRLQYHEISGDIELKKVSEKGCISCYLIYSANMTVAEAVPFAFKLASVDIIAVFLQSKTLDRDVFVKPPDDQEVWASLETEEAAVWS